MPLCCAAFIAKTSSSVQMTGRSSGGKMNSVRDRKNCPGLFVSAGHAGSSFGSFAINFPPLAIRRRSAARSIPRPWERLRFQGP
jgi:hypothetical protein